MPSDGKSRQQRRALAFGGYCWDMALESRLDVTTVRRSIAEVTRRC
jgi:hypothetical protein